MNLNSHGGLGPLITHHYNSGWVVIIVFDDHESKTDSWQITNLSEVCYRRFFTLFACYFLPIVGDHLSASIPVSILQRSISPRLSSCHVLPHAIPSPWVSQQTTHEQRGMQGMSIVALPWLWTNLPKWSRNHVWCFPILYISWWLNQPIWQNMLVKLGIFPR